MAVCPDFLSLDIQAISHFGLQVIYSLTPFPNTATHTLQCAPARMSRWCCSARGKVREARPCVCMWVFLGFFWGFFCFVLFVFIFLFFPPLPSFWIFSLCHYLFCYCTKTMCTLYQMYSFSLALSPGSACSFYILVSFSPPPLPAHHHLLHYGVKFGYVCTPCLWSPPALLRCVHCITTRR